MSLLTKSGDPGFGSQSIICPGSKASFYNPSTAKWSMCCWAKITDWRSGVYRYLMGGSGSSGSPWCQLGWSSSNNFDCTGGSGKAFTVISGDSATEYLGKWVFFFHSYYGYPGNGRLGGAFREDGSLIASATGPFNCLAQTDGQWGWGHSGYSGEYVPGYYAYMRYWRGVGLNLEQFRQEAFSPAPVNSPNLCRIHYKGDDEAVLDASGFQRHGDLYFRSGVNAIEASPEMPHLSTRIWIPRISVPAGGATPVSATLVCAYESEGRVAPTVVVPFETEQGIDQTQASPFEALLTVDQNEADALEALQGVDDTLIVSFECLASVAQTAAAEYEALGAVDAQAIAPYEALLGVRGDLVAALESLGAIDGALSVSYECLGTVPVDQTLVVPFETLGAAYAALSLPFEAQLTISLTATHGIEALRSLSQSTVPPYEALLGLDATLLVPWESLGLTSVEQTLVIPFESEGLIESTLIGSFESLGGLSADGVVGLESLSGIETTHAAAWAALSGVASSVSPPFEAEGGLTAFLVLPWECFGEVSVVSAELAVPFEALGRVSTTLVIPFEVGSELTIREQVMLALEEVLSSINPANGFDNDVKDVQRWQSPRPAKLFPMLMLREMGTVERPVLRGNLDYEDVRLLVEVGIWVREHVAAASEVNEVRMDVERAVMDDPTLGGLAIDTRIPGNESLLAPVGDEPYGYNRVWVQVLFRHQQVEPSLRW